MIQTTAPTPSAAPIGAIAAALALPAGATTFASLLDGTGEPATPKHTLHTGEFTPAMPEVGDATAETLKDGLAALALQAGAAALPRRAPRAGVPAGTPIMPPGATPPPGTTQAPRPANGAPEGRPEIIASHAALAAAIALPAVRRGGDMPTAISKPIPSGETLPGHGQLPADAVGKVEAPGGKDSGNILPEGTMQPVSAEALTAVLPSTPIRPASGATEPLAALPPSVAVAPGRQEPIIDTAPRATTPLRETTVRPNATALPASAIRPAAVTSIPPPEVSTIRFERIDVVHAEPRATPNAPLAPAAMPVAPAPFASAPPARTDHGLSSAALESLPPIAAPSLKARPSINAAPTPRPAAPIEPAVLSVNMPVATPAVVTATTADAHPAPTPTAAHGDETAERLSIKPRESEAAAIRPLPTTAQHTASIVPTLAETVPAATGTIEVTTFTPPADAPHDFDALVARLGEAREAAAPHLVRTAFEHAEFGRVAMQLRHEDGGLSVTLASHDPEFTGAVQAAAASMAGGSAGNSDQPRQDSPASPQGQSQNTAQANAGGQGQQQARTDASGQQARREGGSQPSGRQDQPQSGSQQRGREQRSGGSDVYA